MNRKYTLILIIALLLVAITMSSCTEKEHEHTFSDKKVAASCVTDGYVEHTCTECGYVLRDNIVPSDPKNHAELKKVSVTEPSCEMGYTTYFCEACRKEVIKDYKNPVHDFGEWKLISVICSDGGLWERYCKNEECAQVEQKMDEATHTMENILHVPATELNSECDMFYCDCGEYYSFGNFTLPLSYEYLDFELCEEAVDAFYYKVIGIKEGYENITSIVIPYEVGGIPVTIIDYRAFSDCDNLVSVTLTESLTTIRETAFELCDNLNTFVFTGTFDEWNEIDKGSEWENGTVNNAPYIEEKCIEIEGAHYGYLSHSVAATALESGYVEHYCACGATRYRDTYVAPIGSEALVLELSEDGTYYIVVGYNASKITENLVIPYEYNGIPIKEIYFEAFMQCNVIKTVTLTSNIQWIRSTSFAYCTRLEKFIFVGAMDQWNAIDKGHESGVENVTVELYTEK